MITMWALEGETHVDLTMPFEGSLGWEQFSALATLYFMLFIVSG